MDHNNQLTHIGPQPLCTYFEPQLPLLLREELDAAEEIAIREHLTGCAWCQAQLSEYDDLGLALRRHFGADQSLANRRVTLEEIESASVDTEDDLTLDPSSARLFAPRGPRPRLSAVTALAAALLVAVLVASLFRWQGQPAGPTTVPGLGTLAEFPVPTAASHPTNLIAASDGNLWFTESGQIGRITPRGVITEFSIPADGSLNGLAMGPDGNIWFTDGAGSIGRLNPHDGRVTKFALPSHGVIPSSIVVWEGSLWFEVDPGTYPAGSSELGRITAEGVITEFPLPIANLVVGPDGNLWVAGGAIANAAIGRMSPTGVMRWFPVPGLDVAPCLITAGPDDAIWFIAVDEGYSGTCVGQIKRITPGGIVTAFSLPSNPSLGQNAAGAYDLASGADGNLWFVAGDEHTLGRITPQGAIAEFALPSDITPSKLTAGPDGNLWFSDATANTIDRLELKSP